MLPWHDRSHTALRRRSRSSRRIAAPAFAADRGIILAGEAVQFADDATIHFTERQLRETSAATRAGLMRWAATRGGDTLLDYFIGNRCRIIVREDPAEPGEGRAPQPGMATMIAANDPAAVKVYELILNPTLRDAPPGAVVLPGQPATTADFLAVAWAAEMLHVYFYSRGILLPHHERADFQEQWLKIAAELGFPAFPHGEERAGARPPRVTFVGRRR
jgi:hypothetical protein